MIKITIVDLENSERVYNGNIPIAALINWRHYDEECEGEWYDFICVKFINKKLVFKSLEVKHLRGLVDIYSNYDCGIDGELDYMYLEYLISQKLYV